MFPQVLKYLLEGVAVGASTYLVSKKKVSMNEILMISLSAAATFALLDMLAPDVSSGARQGTGFGLGAQQVGFGMGESFQSKLPGEESGEESGEEAGEESGEEAGEEAGEETGEESEEIEELEGFAGFNSKVHNSRIITEGFQDAADNEDDATAATGVDEVNEVVGQNENAKHIRKSGVVYSGDIVQVLDDSKTKILQRSVVSSELLLKEQITQETPTNLSKMRWELEAHNKYQNKALRYGDKVNLKHNANENSYNKTFYVKYGDKLQTHQVGPLFNVFTMHNADDNTAVQTRKLIRFGDNVKLATTKYGSYPAGWVILQEDGTLKTTGSQTNATIFTNRLVRVAESGDKHLSQGLNEVLFP